MKELHPIRRYYRSDGDRYFTSCPVMFVKIGDVACGGCFYFKDNEGSAVICGAHETNMGIRPKGPLASLLSDNMRKNFYDIMQYGISLSRWSQ